MHDQDERELLEQLSWIASTRSGSTKLYVSLDDLENLFLRSGDITADQLLANARQILEERLELYRENLRKVKASQPKNDY